MYSLLFDLFLIFFFNLGFFYCPCSLECIHVCISFRRLNDDVDISLGNNQSHERNQKPVCGRQQQTEVDETHSLSIGYDLHVKGAMWGVAALQSLFVASCLRAVSLDLRPADEFDGELCDGCDAGRCS